MTPQFVETLQLVINHQLKVITVLVDLFILDWQGFWILAPICINLLIEAGLLAAFWFSWHCLGSFVCLLGRSSVF